MSRASVGSLPGNFEVRQPSASNNAKEVYGALISSEPDYRLPWEKVEEKLPVLYKLMEHNARMLSIATSELRVALNRFDAQVSVSAGEEKVIVQNVFKSFIASNGISHIDERSRPLMAACALAVFLT